MKYEKSQKSVVHPLMLAHAFVIEPVINYNLISSHHLWPLDW